jgi:hypothetical protein
MPLPWQKFRWDACLPWPLTWLCHKDNARGPHDDEIDWVCRWHDRALNVCARLNLLKLGYDGPIPDDIRKQWEAEDADSTRG